jgi:REP element-mobilizing transposase RayT
MVGRGRCDAQGPPRASLGTMRPFYSRLNPRRKSYDYTQPGAYFVTAVTQLRRPVFGGLTRDGVLLTPEGRIVQRCWMHVDQLFVGVTIDTFVVMPDHTHAIVVLSPIMDRSVGLSQVVGWVKQRASRRVNQINQTNRTHPESTLASPPLWQRGFHDRIITDPGAFTRIRHYIVANPARAWAAQESRTHGVRW